MPSKDASTMHISETFFRIAEWARSEHGGPLDDIEGLWHGTIDYEGSKWSVTLNPGNEKRCNDSGNSYDPFTVVVWFNGWPAGSFDVRGGVLAAGAAANEDALLTAIAAEMKRNGWGQIDTEEE